MNFRRHLGSNSGTNCRRVDVLGQYVSVLVLRDDRLKLVHGSKADIAKAEDIAITGWLLWLTLVDEWVPIGHDSKIVDKNLPSLFVNALCKGSFHILIWSFIFKSSAINDQVPGIIQLL